MNPPIPGMTSPASFFMRLFEASPHPYLVLRADAGFTIEAVNDRYLEATGTRREAIVGHGLFAIFPDNPDDLSGSGVSDLRASLNRVLGDRRQDIMGVQKYDIPLRDGSGGFEVRYWSPVNTPVFGPDGGIVHIIHHVEDVTEFILGRERAQQESGELLGKVEARAEQMEAEVMRRAAEVKEANRALKTAMEALEQREAELTRLNERLTELDRVKTRFFAKVSHELRTPLTLILGPVGKRLARGGLDESERRDLEVVERNAQLLYRHVTDLLDIAKLEAGSMALRYGRTDLARVVRLMASHFEVLAIEKGIRLVVETPESVAAQADEEKLRRILLNLLSNAFKFTPDGGTVILALEPVEGQAVIRVQDNGPGVPAHLRETIFEPFRQGEDDSNRRYGGTGLGLAIVREFVGLHGGTVRVDTTPGGGACFIVRLPLTAPADAVISDSALVPDERITHQMLDELHGRAPCVARDAAAANLPLVLVVEDNPDMNAYVAEALAGKYRVVSAFDGREGVQRALALHPDLILGDVMMPGMSGDEMVVALRRHPEMADVPIVMLTANMDEDLRVRLLKTGVQDYIAKPFVMDELLARIDAIVGSRRDAALRQQESDLRFESIFQQAAVGIALVATDGRWLRVNQKLCEIVGYDQDELLARTFQDITHPDDLAADLDCVRRMLAGDIATYSMEKRYLRKDGGLVWINLTVSLVRKGDGSPDCFIKVIEDISGRKQAEAERCIAAVAFDGRDGMIVTDTRGVILKVNPSFTRVTGYGAGDAVGKTPSLLCSGRHGAAFYQGMWEAIRREGHWEGQIWNRRKDGGIYPEWLAISAIRDPAGVITHYLGVFSDIREPHEAERRIIELAFYDALTGLPNRRLLQDRLAQTLAASARSGSHGAVMLLDLDHFKTLNDTRGHDVGDQLLIEVAQRLRGTLRETDTAARLGGDEFVMLLEQLGEDEAGAAADAEIAAEKLRAVLEQPCEISGRSYPVSTSIGITLFRGHRDSPEALFRQADLALYQAKTAGRNLVRFFDPTMQAAVDARAELEIGLRNALAGGELLLFYQPQVGADGRLLGVEALLRWQPPGRLMNATEDFIPVAEDSDLILAIGRWVLETACNQIAVWARDPSLRALHVAVNVSARQFRQPDFAAQVRCALETCGIDPARLKLELTESAIVEDMEQAVRTMREIKDMGVGFSMDDFGTGYSSLANLKRLPLDQLKIDQSFVREIPADPGACAITEAVIALGKAMHLHVIAEGVETMAQRDFLARMGCRAYQGYLFGRPGPAAAIEALAKGAAMAIPSSVAVFPQP